jgi:hypothetical protein
MSDEPAGSPAPWSPARRVLFRFFTAYVLLALFPVPLGSLPGVDGVANFLDVPRRLLAVWVGKYLFQLNVTHCSSQFSSDTTCGYVGSFCLLSLAAAATIVWSVLDRRRTEYRRLHDWLRVYVRYALAAMMFVYGMAKIVKVQFPFPGPVDLLQPLGDLSLTASPTFDRTHSMSS